MTLLNHVRGEHGPLAAIFQSGFLAIPELCLGNVNSDVGKTVFVDQDVLQAALLYELLHFGKSLVPVEIGIAHQGVAGMAGAQ